MKRINIENKKYFYSIIIILLCSTVIGCVGQRKEIKHAEIQPENNAAQATAIRHDPIEDNPKFKNVFATIDSEVGETLKHHPRRGAIGFCHIFWDTKKRILSEVYGINWKTPAEMNPHILFD